MIIEEKIKDYKTIIATYSKVLFNTIRDTNIKEINSLFYEKIYNELENINKAYIGTELEELSRNLFLMIYAEITKEIKKQTYQE